MRLSIHDRLPHIACSMRILILHAHPRPSSSIVQRALSSTAKSIPGVTFHDLYAAYPDFGIDAAQEQALLLEHDIIIFQHPFYWYSSPAIIKEWQDIVLEFGWAYGPGGDKLHGKFMMQAMSTGGAEGFYHPKGRNRFTVDELLRPFNQTAHLCGMAYLEPFLVYEGRRISDDELEGHSSRYRDLLTDMVEGTFKPLKHLAEGYTLPANFKSGARP
jgi:glutathione-regulated potassium-efflux system ancillary protein KefG